MLEVACEQQRDLLAAPSTTAAAAAGAGKGTLSAAFMQQVQQSGLLQQLPVLIATTADELQYTADELQNMQQAADPDARANNISSILRVSELKQTVTGNLLRAIAALTHLSDFDQWRKQTGASVSPVRLVAALMVSTLRFMSCLAAATAAAGMPPRGSQTVLMEAADAGLQQLQRVRVLEQIGKTHALSMYKMQVLDDIVRLSTGVLLHGRAALHRCCHELLGAASSSNGSGSSNKQLKAAQQQAARLVGEACFLQCLRWVTVVKALAATAAGSSTGASSSNAGSSGSRSPSRAAGARGVSGAQQQVPEGFAKVLQQLGCSTGVALAAVATLRTARSLTRQHHEDSLACALGVYGDFVNKQLPGEGQVCTGQFVQGREQQVLLHLLMCVAVLQYALDNTSATDMPRPWVNEVCRISCNGVTCASGLLQQLTPRLVDSSTDQPQQQQGQAQGQGQGQGQQQQGQGHQWQQPLMDLQLFHRHTHKECVVLSMNLLARLLQVWRHTAAGIAASGQQAGNSSSSSSQDDDSKCLALSIKQLGLGLTKLLGDEACVKPSAVASFVQAVDSTDGLDVQQQQQEEKQEQEEEAMRAGQVCGVLSDLTRACIEAAQTTATTNSSSSSDRTPIDSMEGGLGLDQHVASFLGDSMWSECDTKALLAEGAGPVVRPLLSTAGRDCGSSQHLQLFDLLCSLLKSCTVSRQLLLDQGHAGMLPPAEIRSRLLMVVSNVSAAVVSAAADAAAVAVAAAEAAANGGGDTCVAAGSCSVTALLPWLVLLGRCCLLWAEQLPALPQSEVCRCHAALPVLLAPVVRWLDAGSDATQLAAMGYGTRPLQQQLQGVQASLPEASGTSAAETARQNGAAECAAAATGGPAADPPCEQLQLVGQSLTAFAIRHACNNPSCANVSGPSEARMVVGKSCICAGCHTARYCGTACQKQHWKQHKPVCKRLAAAAVAAKQQESVSTAYAATG